MTARTRQGGTLTETAALPDHRSEDMARRYTPSPPDRRLAYAMEHIRQARGLEPLPRGWGLGLATAGDLGTGEAGQRLRRQLEWLG